VTGAGSGIGRATANIRVNAVCPGIIDTAMMQRFTGDTPVGRDRVIGQEPVGRMGTPEEIAKRCSKSSRDSPAAQYAAGCTQRYP
jgi:NAD(P)-dependent dehydrogenase (short-subunit alcohol dehydrogenase family)